MTEPMHHACWVDESGTVQRFTQPTYDELRAEVGHQTTELDDLDTKLGNALRAIGLEHAENERLRAALETVGPRLEAHHAAMAAGDLMPCAICGDDEDDGAE